MLIYALPVRYSCREIHRQVGEMRLTNVSRIIVENNKTEGLLTFIYVEDVPMDILAHRGSE